MNCITLGKAWEKYAMIGKSKKHGFTTGLNVFLYTKLFDFESDGQATAIHSGKKVVSSLRNPSIINLWL